MRLQSVRFDHPRFDGLQQLNLGPVTALWGANDSGKSTTLRALSAVLDADPEASMASVELRGTIPVPIAEELAMRVIDGVLSGEPLSLLDGTELYADELSDAARVDLEGARDNGTALTVLASVLATLDRGSDAPRIPGVLPADGVPISCVLARDQDQETAGWQVWASLRDSNQQHVAVPLMLSPDPELKAPIPVDVPLAWEAIERRLDGVAGELTAHVQAALERTLDEVSDAEDIRRRLGEYVGCRAGGDLPDFVGLRYQLRVDVRSGGQLHVRARRIADGAAFDVRDLAEGFRPWLQLAVLVGTARLEVLARMVEQTDVELQPHRASELDAVLRLVAELSEETSDALSDVLGGLIDTTVGDDVDLPTASRADLLRMGQTVVLMDEPEAHLHPAAQRQAARWIHRHAVHLCDSFVMVSHAPTFLGMEGLADVSHVSRSADHRVIVRPLDPRDLSAIDDEIEELGFDRGELLALYRAVLFVEGAGDQAVLETLYAEELRDTGILVQSFSGASTHRKITEAELLLRVLGPPFHVLVDNVAPDRVEELVAAGAEVLEAATRDRARPDEEKFLAHILLAGHRQSRPVRVHGLSVRDILGALDADVVAELGRTNGARQAWPGLGVVVATAKERGAKYDSLLGDFGVSKRPDFMRECAQQMKRRGISAPELDDVVYRVRTSIQ